jgi:hypothetical protein
MAISVAKSKNWLSQITGKDKTMSKIYIESPQFWKDMYLKPEFTGKWVSVNKVPISKIQIDRSLFAWNNPIYPSQVDDMATNFNRELWTPITVNPDYFLLDGQHRLTVAIHLGLRYIDVIIEHDNVDEAENEPPKKFHELDTDVAYEMITWTGKKH